MIGLRDVMIGVRNVMIGVPEGAAVSGAGATSCPPTG
jgi:hypothetical protein